MRNMSFMMTTEAFANGSKTVTRRLGWWNVKPGDRLMGVQKSQGLKKGEKVVKLHPIEIVRPRWELLCEITPGDMPREGFPDMSTEEFIERFIEHNWAKCKKDRERTLVNRIEFKHLSLCPGCLYPVRHLGDYCGECLCEDDGYY
jgi:hypothetical protein